MASDLGAFARAVEQYSQSDLRQPHPALIMMMMAPIKLCFVTVGATASFEKLLCWVLEESFLDALSKNDYTHLLVQYGKDGSVLYEYFQHSYPQGSERRHGIEVDGFDFKQEGLSSEMQMTQANPAVGRKAGMIVSHAGSGSVLEALRLGVPLVVVPNPDLQDNHQEELAQEMQKLGYAIASHFRDVSGAIAKAEALRSRMPGWPPVQDSKKQQSALGQVMADEMGFLD